MRQTLKRSFAAKLRSQKTQIASAGALCIIHVLFKVRIHLSKVVSAPYSEVCVGSFTFGINRLFTSKGALQRVPVWAGGSASRRPRAALFDRATQAAAREREHGCTRRRNREQRRIQADPA